MELESAIERILGLIPAARPESADLADAHGRIVSAQILSTIDLPGFDNSAMDGYAVRAGDLQNASATAPVILQLIGRVAAGEMFTGEVSAGVCVRIFTGSPLPRGADAVIMQEDTRVDPSDAAKIHFLDSVKAWENIRFRGEDIKIGASLATAGTALTAGRINLLAATGVRQVAVGMRPQVGLLATGSELVEAGSPLVDGKLYESNRLGLATLMKGVGAIPKIYPLVKDSPTETRAALENAFSQCDIVVTSGGVSVGEMDFIKSAFEAMGGQLEFWKVAIRPGRPFVFGRYENKFLFGLPGNPVSAFITFLLLARPALLRWQGAVNVNLPTNTGKLLEPLANPAMRRHLMRVTVDGGGNVRLSGVQASHMLMSLAEANGLVDVPAQTTFAAGNTVRVMRWE